MTNLAREWSQRVWLVMASSIFAPVFQVPCVTELLIFFQDGKRDTTLLYSCFIWFPLSWSLPHYLASLRLPLSSWPNLTKQHSTSQTWLCHRGAVQLGGGCPDCDSVGKHHGGRSGSGKNSELRVRKPLLESPIYWMCYPRKSPVPTSLSLIPLFIHCDNNAHEQVTSCGHLKGWAKLQNQ